MADGVGGSAGSKCLYSRIHRTSRLWSLASSRDAGRAERGPAAGRQATAGLAHGGHQLVQGRARLVQQVLHSMLKANNIIVNHDMLGAVRALCGTEPGIACILGTGSNAVYFDGKKLIKNRESLGFILGDEGSGANIGKKMLTDFLYNRVPTALKEYIRDELNH